MQASDEDVEFARSLVARALSVSAEQIEADTSMYKIPAWDSFGQLSVVLAIEEALRVDVIDEATFKSLSRVDGIARYVCALRKRAGS